MRILLLALALLLGAALPARAELCSAYGGLLDGFAGDVPPSQIQIDQNCTLRNYPASNPLRTNFSFFTQPGQNDDRYLVVFDNVVHTGQMSCNSNDVQNHKIWFTNGSSTSIKDKCQELLIPVEKIDKQTPAGQTTVAIGVPFTYTLTIPVLFDPATGTVINDAGSVNDLHSIIVTDDLAETGVDLGYVSHVAYWKSDDTSVDHTFTQSGDLLTFEITPVVEAGDQIVIEITVVLEDTAANSSGTTFVNTAKWEFGRLIDGVFYQPLPGEWGISPPLTIATPELVVTKTGPATLGRTLNLGEWGEFAIDVENVGFSDAWNTTIVDRLPDESDGGMCDMTPQILDAQVFASDGSPIPGKDPLVEDSDFSLSYSSSPTCELELTILTAAGTIGPGEHLVVRYRTQLDSDSQDGAMLTNVAGATRWFNGDDSNPDRQSYTRALTDGTPNDPDHQDAHTVTVALYGYFFEKTVENLDTGANPTATAAPGEKLRYSLRLQATDVALDDVAFQDDLGALNASVVFAPGSLEVVQASLPPLADDSNTDPTAGTNGAGILDVRGLSVPAGSEVVIQFDITVDPSVADGTVVLNQADLVSTVKIADSDDPNINGQADPNVPGDEDPTRVVIAVAPPAALLKANTRDTAAVGEEFRYRITVPESPNPFPMYDVQILDDLAASAANLRFVSVEKISGGGSWTPVNTGSDYDLVIEDPGSGIDVPADQQIVVEITVVLEDTATNTAGLTFRNEADYAYYRLETDVGPRLPGAPGTTEPMTIVEPELTLEKSGPAQMTVGDPPEVFTLDVHNTSTTPAWDLTISDRLPDDTTGGMCDAAPSVLTARVFESNGSTPVSDPLVQGADFDVSFAGAPDCLFTLTITSAAGTIGPDERLIVTYETVLDADTQHGVSLTNFAGATEWSSADGSSPDRRSYARIVTDGTPDDLDYQDAHTVEAQTTVPSIFAAKSVELYADSGTPDAVDPGDVLLYTITVQNSGGVAATGVVLTDAVPADTTYVDDSVTLNGDPVPDAGGSPLEAGIPISSGDLTPPPPGPGEGTLSSGGTAVIQFRVQVDANVPGGTLISNQAFVASDQLPAVPSDGDGDPTTGPEPTVVVVSDGQQLLITKTVTVVGGGTALPGSVLEYAVNVLNVALVPAFGVVITDDLEASTPGTLSYVDDSALLDGSATGVDVLLPVVTADYFGSYGALPPGQATELRFRAVIDPGLATGTTVTNLGVVTWNTPPDTASASVSVDVGGMPGVGTLSGSLWHDENFDDVQDAGETPLEGWSVTLYRNGQPDPSVLSDAAGAYTLGGLAPNDASGDTYELRFSAPGAGASTASLGVASSPFTNGPQQIRDIVVSAGEVVADLDLPIDPNGVVYDSIQRTPIGGATLMLLDAASDLPLSDSCFDDPAQQGQVTLAGGFYKFDVDLTQLACQRVSYRIAVAAPGPGYVTGYSQILPPTSGPGTPPFSVPSCPGDAVLATAQYCEVQAQASPPVGGADTRYHVHLVLDESAPPGSSQIFNNHIPLDPELDGAVAISKKTPSRDVSRGQLVPYEITVSSELPLDVLDVRIVDRFPAGFHYVDGSAHIDGIRADPVIEDGELVWTGLTPGTSNQLRLTLILVVGAGVGEGRYVNRAQVFSNLTDEAVSGEATATVRVAPDPTFSCTDAIGKVFDDANQNGVQDPGEPGLPGVRLVTVRGLVATTDAYGRYHITCALTPNESRGGNFVLKLDDRSLPSGYRLSTRKVQMQRATAGKALRLNYAASIHHVVSLDLVDAVFEPGSPEIRLQWRPRIPLLIEELRKAPAILRLSYVADVEDASLVERRLEAVKQMITEMWKAEDAYELAIESEVFWRRGAAPGRARGSVWGSR